MTDTTASVPAVATEPTTSVVPFSDEWSEHKQIDLSPDPMSGLVPLAVINRKLDGGLTHPVTGEVGVREFDFIWMAKSRSRAWWPEPFGKGEPQPQCRSFNAIGADPKSPLLQNGGDCTTCSRADDWDEVGGLRCRESLEVLAFMPDPKGLGQFARLRFGGLGVTPAKMYWQSFDYVVPPRPSYAFLTHCTLEETDTKNGTFLVPRFERLRSYGASEMDSLIGMTKDRIEAWKQAIESDVVAGVTGDAEAEAKATPTEREPFPDDAADKVAEAFDATDEPF